MFVTITARGHRSTSHHRQHLQHPRGQHGVSENCTKPTDENKDLHIILLHSQDDDEEESVTAEAIPHKRPTDWTPDNLQHFNDHLFRFTGQLSLDTSHKVCTPADGIHCGPK